MSDRVSHCVHHRCMSYCHSMADTVANHSMAKTMAKELGGSRSGGGKGSDTQEALIGKKFDCKLSDKAFSLLELKLIISACDVG